MTKSYKALLSLGMLVLFPASSYAFGAIAVADSKGNGEPIFGIVTKYANKGAAGLAAIAKCTANGGKGCRVVIEFERCGSIAASASSFGVGEGITGRSARNMSMRLCRVDECRVIGNECEDY